MKTIGIIAEFNPFHNGHEYIIQQSKQITGADSCIIAMSGNFVQRGEPACVDKYLRTRLALMHGADVVFELPTIFATASAEFFARGAVDLLAGTGIVDAICFGTEHPDFPFDKVAAFLLDPTEEFDELIKKHLCSGDHYALARSKALAECFPLVYPASAGTLTKEQFAEPNTILGIEYAKAALSHELPLIPILRVGEGYHSLSSEGELLSASAIRSQMHATNSDCTEIFGVSDLTKQELAQYSKHLLHADSISDLLYHALLLNEAEGYTRFFDCDLELSNRIQKNLKNFESFSQFAELIKTKNYTYSRISRVLLHIVLNITDEIIPDMDSLFVTELYNHCPYLRLLGFKKESSHLLSEIKEHAELPILSKMADAKDSLGSEAYEILKCDIYASKLYEQLAFQSAKSNEMAQSPIVL